MLHQVLDLELALFTREKSEQWNRVLIFNITMIVGCLLCFVQFGDVNSKLFLTISTLVTIGSVTHYVLSVVNEIVLI
jgi:hypothetical protein